MELKQLEVKISIMDLNEVIDFAEGAKSEIKMLQNALESKNSLVSENMMLRAKIEAYEGILNKHNIDERPR